jgi:hypothetical protein
MLIKVLNHEQAGAYEWCLLEFQGEIVGDMVGDLGQIEMKNDIAFMDLGQHTLEGTVVKLKAAFMVVEKERSGEEQGPGSSSTLAMRGVVRHKIIFKQRPKPKGLNKK